MNQSSANFMPATQRIAFLHATWHEDIVLNCLDGLKKELIARGYVASLIDVIPVHGLLMIVR
jgi:6,7-dimethyl-8-ribityllumazine synthase